MGRLNTENLHLTFAEGTTPERLILPRRYTLTHSDMTGKLFLTVGREYDRKQISSLYTRLMRDEVLAELLDEGSKLALRVYCHVSGGLAIGSARWRNDILHNELPLVLEAIRYGDKFIFEQEPKLNSIAVFIHFQSNQRVFNKIESWGTLDQYAH